MTRNLVKPVNHGRIWRIVPENWQASNPKKLSAASSAELVAELSNPDGWHRDMAQRLLIERNDKSTRQALTDVSQERPESVWVAFMLCGRWTD